MNTQPANEAKNPDVRGAEAAMVRAAEAARTTAKQYNIPIVVQKNGRTVKLAVQ